MNEEEYYVAVPPLYQTLFIIKVFPRLRTYQIILDYWKDKNHAYRFKGRNFPVENLIIGLERWEKITDLTPYFEYFL